LGKYNSRVVDSENNLNVLECPLDFPVKTADQLGPIQRACCKTKGLTQGELALKTGVSQQALSVLEKRHYRASVERLLSVVSALGVGIVLRETQPTPDGPGPRDCRSG